MEQDYNYKSNECDISSSNVECFNVKYTKINKKYMLNLGNNSILVYDFNKQSILKIIKYENQIVYHFNFHSYNENIFFVCAGKNVMLYEIDNTNINEISIIEGHFIDVNYGCFNPFNSNIFLSASEDGFIKIYDITNSSPISLIDVMESLEYLIEIKWNKNFIGFRRKNYVLYFKYDNFKKENIKKYTSNKLLDFYFLNDYDDSLIIIKQKDLEIVRNNKKSFEYKETIKASFFCMKSKILTIINSKEIKGLKFNDDNHINEIFKFIQNSENLFSTPLFINENYLNSNEICQFHETVEPFIISSLIITCNNIIEKKIIENDNNQTTAQNIKKKISDIPILISKNNDYYNTFDILYSRSKNYFEIPSIKKELDAVKKRSFLERKNIVRKYSEEKNKNVNKDIIIQYIDLLCLLTNDNTNKDLIKDYLVFLEKNKEKLKNVFRDYFEEYTSELNYYSKLFNEEESMSDFKFKTKSQKKEFNEFLQSISLLDKDNENDIKKFENDLKQCINYFENIPYFNMPIEFSNEQLFYYRTMNIIKYHLINVDDYIKKNIEEKIKETNKNELIKSDTEKKETKEKIENYKKFVISEELDKIKSNIKLCYDIIKNSNDLKMINDLITSLIFASDKELFNCCYKYITSAKRNIDIIIQQNKNTDLNNILVYNEKVNIDLNLIKKFYKKILPLKCFKSIFLTLNGEDSYYPFENKEFTDYFVDNNFEVLDIPIFTNSGLTDKFTMKIYLIPFLSKIYNENKYQFENEKNIMKYGYFIRTGNHEIGHNFTNFKFYMENCKISMKSPRKKTLKFIEGGYYLDLALFGKILEKINLEQILYILNEKNYEKTYLDFQFGFNNIKKEDLIIKGVFEEMCGNISKNLNDDFRKKAELVYISLNPSSIEKAKIYCGIKNDVLFGNKISNEDYERILKEYS